MLHYCPENVSAYYYSQLEIVTIKFQDGCQNYQLKMAVKTIEHVRFGVNSA